MLLWRKTGGSSSSVWLKAWVWSAIALNAVLALEIALVSCSPRSETAVESLLVLTTNWVSRRESALSPWAKAAARLSPGAKYL